MLFGASSLRNACRNSDRGSRFSLVENDDAGNRNERGDGPQGESAQRIHAGRGAAWGGKGRKGWATSGERKHRRSIEGTGEANLVRHRPEPSQC